MTILSTILGLLAAALFAAAAALQHRVTRTVAQARGDTAGHWLPVLGTVARLLRSPVWLAGLGCNVLGFAAHASALHTGSIAIVQALLAVQLMFALPMSYTRTGRPPAARDWLGTAAVCAGLAVLVLTRGGVAQTVRREPLPAVLLAAIVLIGVLLTVARSRLGRTARTALTGVAAGTGFSTTAVLTVVVADQLAVRGPVTTALDWPVYALGLSGLVAAVLAQEAFGSGSLPAALTAMTVADPVLSWLWGALLFDEAPPAGLSALWTLTLAGAAIAAGVALLAYSPTLRVAAAGPSAGITRAAGHAPSPVER
ncbi:DMT family transporter [Catellatospora sichuanensis]|uniref:DMT family transporter n=1 Tax=Catellatospora sichuanensis TaxID=1969805 RepID=UPI00164260AF|nr:DMT family transporter [Catellatospora sichuanensis]